MGPRIKKKKKKKRKRGKKGRWIPAQLNEVENYVVEVAVQTLDGRFDRFSTRHRGATRLERVLERVLSAWYSREPVVRLCPRLTMSGMPRDDSVRARTYTQDLHVSIAPLSLSPWPSCKFECKRRLATRRLVSLFLDPMKFPLVMVIVYTWNLIIMHFSFATMLQYGV